MSSLILPRRFQAQPQGPVEIDWSNPLTSGLFDAWTAQTLAYQSALGRKPISSGAVGYTTGKFGIGVFATSASIRYERSALNLTLPHSCVALATVPANAQASYVRINNIFIPLQKWNADTRAAGADPWSIPVYGTAAETAVFCAVRENINSVAVYKDGAYVARASNSSSYKTSADPLCLLGSETNGELVTSSVGCLYSAALWSRALQPDEIAELASNPWQIFKPRKFVLYFGAAAGGTTVTPGAGGYTFSGNAPTIAQPRTVAPSAGSVVYAGNAPTISQPHTVAPAVGAVVALGYAPSLIQGVSVAPGAGAVAYAGNAPTIAQPRTVAPSAGSVVYAGQAATIAQPHTVAPSAGAATILGYAPSIQQAAGIYPGAGAVGYAGQAPTISQPHTVSPGVGAYDILGYAPTVSQAAGVAPLAGSIIVLGYAPSIAQPHTVSPGAGAAVWLGQTPTISQAASSFTEAQLQEILAYVEANMAVPTTAEIAAAVWAEILSGSSAADRLVGMATAILAAAQAAPIHADMRKVRGQDIDGAGTEADPWGPA